MCGCLIDVHRVFVSCSLSYVRRCAVGGERAIEQNCGRSRARTVGDRLARSPGSNVEHGLAYRSACPFRWRVALAEVRWPDIKNKCSNDGHSLLDCAIFHTKSRNDTSRSGPHGRNAVCIGVMCTKSGAECPRERAMEERRHRRWRDECRPVAGRPALVNSLKSFNQISSYGFSYRIQLELPNGRGFVLHSRKTSSRKECSDA